VQSLLHHPGEPGEPDGVAYGNFAGLARSLIHHPGEPASRMGSESVKSFTSTTLIHHPGKLCPLPISLAGQSVFACRSDPCLLARQVKEVEWLEAKQTRHDPCRLVRQVKKVERLTPAEEKQTQRGNLLT